MHFRNLANYIINTRPLVFLCGPYFDENDKKDRRNILRKYFSNFEIKVSYSNKYFDIKPFALIVDNLFDNEILSNQMNVTLIEEIISACAYKNYVFVDTMSTALELGLFSNSYAANKTTALLPKDYKFFKPSIGYFVTETLDKSENISVCEYNNRRYNKYIRKKDNSEEMCVIENLVGFRANKLPNEIENEVKKDFSSEYVNYLIDMNFTRNILETDKIFYDIKCDELSILVPPQNLFYLVNKYSNIEQIYNVLIEYFRQNICTNSPEMMKIYYMIKNKKMKLIINSPFKYPIEEVIKNMKYLIDSLKGKLPFPKKFSNLEYIEIYRLDTLNEMKFYQLIGFTYQEMKKLNKLSYSKSKCITHKKLYINGKIRKVKMYKSTSEGFMLRCIHNKINDSLNQLIELSDRSFAYRKNLSIKDCVNEHLGNSHFLKLDIHNFFNSITKRNLNKILKMKFSECTDEMYKSNIKGETSQYKSNIIDTWDGVEKVLDFCFVNSKLPLGLVTSPILANIYMDFFDRRFKKEFPDLVYTRYSDDILISFNTTFDTKIVKDFIEKELEVLKLKMNKKKIIEVKLHNVGDHVKFLGINIVNGIQGNYITVGKSFVSKVCMDTTNYIKGDKRLKKSQIIGEIEYLKYINRDDYKYFLSLFKIKTGNDFIYNNFKNIN